MGWLSTKLQQRRRGHQQTKEGLQKPQKDTFAMSDRTDLMATSRRTDFSFSHRDDSSQGRREEEELRMVIRRMMMEEAEKLKEGGELSQLIKNALIQEISSSASSAAEPDVEVPNEAPKTDDTNQEENSAITTTAVMEAATIEINRHIAEHGSISESESIAIIRAKKAIVDKLWSIFPGAMTSQDVLEGYKKVFEPRGYTAANTLFAQSVCPDEVNHEDGDITDLFIKYHGECFHAGGLGGLMFTGKVGFGAFSHHVPDGGHCAIMYAPHIGLDNEGNLGAYSRDGQAHSGSCCGAAVGAYKTCMACSGDPKEVSTDPGNFQFDYIVSQVAKRKNEIVGKTECEKQGALAMLMYDIGNDMLEKAVGVEFGDENSTLVVLTGIQINMPRPFKDFFLPMDFYIMHKDGTTENVFEQAFGPRRTLMTNTTPGGSSSEHNATTTTIVKNPSLQEKVKDEDPAGSDWSTGSNEEDAYLEEEPVSDCMVRSPVVHQRRSPQTIDMTGMISANHEVYEY